MFKSGCLVFVVVLLSGCVVKGDFVLMPDYVRADVEQVE
ncbi:MAG: putative small lipoprotein YifL [Reinekea sp.]|jgi:predicted small lipoprotein YifL